MARSSFLRSPVSFILFALVTLFACTGVVSSLDGGEPDATTDLGQPIHPGPRASYPLDLDGAVQGPPNANYIVPGSVNGQILTTENDAAVWMDATTSGGSLEAGTSGAALMTYDGGNSWAGTNDLNVLLLGCDRTGTIDSTACINAAMTLRTALAAGDSGVGAPCLYFPAGIYMTTSMITETYAGACWRGDRSNVVSIYDASDTSTGSVIRLATAGQFAVQMAGNLKQRYETITFDANENAIFAQAGTSNGYTSWHQVFWTNATHSGYYDMAAPYPTTNLTVTQTDGGGTPTLPVLSGNLTVASAGGQFVEPWEAIVTTSGSPGGSLAVKFSDNAGVNTTPAIPIPTSGVFDLPYVQTYSNNPAARSWTGMQLVFAGAYAANQVFSFSPVNSPIPIGSGIFTDQSSEVFDNCEAQYNGIVYKSSGFPAAFPAGYGGLSAISPGTVTYEGYASTITGVGTAWTTLGLRAGDWFAIYDGTYIWPCQITSPVTDDLMYVDSSANGCGAAGGSGFAWAAMKGAGIYMEIFREQSAACTVLSGNYANNGAVGVKADGRNGCNLINISTPVANGACGASMGVALNGSKPTAGRVDHQSCDTQGIACFCGQQGHSQWVSVDNVGAAPSYAQSSSYAVIKANEPLPGTTAATAFQIGENATLAYTGYTLSGQTVQVEQDLPRADFDLAGSFALRHGPVGLTNGTNNDVESDYFSVIRAEVSGSATTITGLAFGNPGSWPPQLGQELWVENNNGFGIGYVGNSGSSFGNDLINTPGGVGTYQTCPYSTTHLHFTEGNATAPFSGWVIETPSPWTTCDAAGDGVAQPTAPLSDVAPWGMFTSGASAYASAATNVVGGEAAVLGGPGKVVSTQQNNGLGCLGIGTPASPTNLLCVGGDATGWGIGFRAPTSIATTGGTTTLTSAQASSPLVIVTGTLTSTATIVYPNLPGLGYMSVRGLTLSGNSLVIESGSASQTITSISVGTTDFLTIESGGSNTLTVHN
jgi:hypothetical protein